mgnify:CR=1 FL=1
MKLFHVSLAVIAIIAYNGVLIRRDKEMFEAYDKICAELPQSHPDCRYAK